MSQSQVPYEPLAVDDEPASPPLKEWVPPGKPQTTLRAWAFFLGAVALSLVLSALNLSAISAEKTYNAVTYYATKTPSVYMGLERVKLKTPMCRGRGSFPKRFYTVQGDDWQHRTHVHAPADKIRFQFGGHTSGMLDFYFPDVGLENCTLTTQGFRDSGSRFELYKLDNMRGDITGRELISTLDFSKHPGTFELTTKPFYCPSRTHMLFLWTCPDPGCKVDFPLAGVTHMTAGDKSRNATGLRLTQWEHLHCIPGQK